MELVTSSDGTAIAVFRSGVGPPLLLVHGASADHTTTWRFVLPGLESRFTVYAMDRRGRGDSGDSPEYDLSREAEDICAVMEAIGEPVNVLGHSYGALCAIEAAAITLGIRRLVLYEGVPLRGAGLYPPGLVERLGEMLRAGDAEGVLLTMFREIVLMPEEEIAMLRSQTAAWERRLANTRTLPRELHADSSYVFDAARFSAMRTPTLLMVGGNSPSRELENARAVAAALPDASITVIPRQQHAAMYTVPDLFVSEVAKFLSG